MFSNLTLIKYNIHMSILMITEIPIDVSDFELKNIFALYGSCSLDLVRNDGIITFSNKRDCINAYENLHQKFNLKITSLGRETRFTRKKTSKKRDSLIISVPKEEETNLEKKKTKNKIVLKLNTKFTLLQQIFQEYPIK